MDGRLLALAALQLLRACRLPIPVLAATLMRTSVTIWPSLSTAHDAYLEDIVNVDTMEQMVDAALRNASVSLPDGTYWAIRAMHYLKGF